MNKIKLVKLIWQISHHGLILNANETPSKSKTLCIFSILSQFSVIWDWPIIPPFINILSHMAAKVLNVPSSLSVITLRIIIMDTLKQFQTYRAYQYTYTHVCMYAHTKVHMQTILDTGRFIHTHWSLCITYSHTQTHTHTLDPICFLPLMRSGLVGSYFIVCFHTTSTSSPNKIL